MKLKRVFTGVFALVLTAVTLLAAVPALALTSVDVEIALADAGSSTGATYILASVENKSAEAIKLTSVSCTGATVDAVKKAAPEFDKVEIGAGETAQILLTLKGTGSLTGTATATYDITFTSLVQNAGGTYDIVAKSASVGLNFGEPSTATPAPTTDTPAFRLSAYDMKGNFVSTPSGNAGDKVTVRIPLMCIAGPVDQVTVAPVLSTSLEEFPFDITQVDYSLRYDTWVAQNEIVVCEFTNLKLAKKVTAGVKKVDFTVSYVPSGWTGDGNTIKTMTVSIYVNVVKGYTESVSTDKPTVVSQPKLILESYSMSSDKIYAGEEFEVTFTLRNTSDAEAVKNIQISITDTLDTGKLLPAENGSNTLYVAKIDKGEAYTVNYKMQSAADIEPKAYKLGLALAYEGAKNVASYTASETISVTVLQKVRLKFDDPVFYDDCYSGQTCAAYLAMYNMGRSSVYNCMLAIEGDGLELEETFFGGTVSAGGTMRADFNVVTNTPGQIDGFLVFTYEDSLGEQMEERIPISLYVEDMGGGGEGDYYEPGLVDPMIDAYSGMEETKPGLPTWAWIAIIVGALLCGGVVLIVVLKNKRAKALD